MAGIDKIYGSTEQWDEFYNWCKDNNPEALGYFHPREDYGESIRPITNFPEMIDRWLLKNCSIPFVIGRIKEQYNIEA